jgi:ABC-type sugar transport system ATPase subunit
LAHTPKREIKEAVERAATLLKIEQFLNRKPDQLSGGQKQRVAIARGLVKKTELFLLDDPLVGLDFKLRERLIDDLKQTQEQLKMTFIYTTSEAVEAMQLAKNIAVMDAGEIVEVGPPEQLYTNPAQAQTMKFVGFPQANFIAGTLSQKNGHAHLSTGLFEAAVSQSNPTQAQTSVTVGIRPEHIVIGQPPTGTLSFRAKVLLREDLGGEEIVYLDANGQQLTTMLRSNDTHIASTQPIDIDQTITAYLHPQDAVVFGDGKYVGRGQ